MLIPLLTGDRPHAPSGEHRGGRCLVMSIGILARGSAGGRARARASTWSPEAGEELTAETFLFGWVLRDRLTARGTAGLLTVGLAVVGLAALAACLVAPTALGAESCGDACVGTVSAGRDGAPGR